MRRKTQVVLSVFDIDPFRIGGTEVYARELSSQLAECGWKSILCFTNTPPEPVHRFMSLPNVRFEVLRQPSGRSLQSVRELGGILARYRPEILHLHHVPLLSAHPWLARIYSVRKVFYTDHWSRPVTYVPHRSESWKRTVGRVVSLPITGVIAVSDYGKRCMATSGLVSSNRIRRIHNAVALTADGGTAERAACFRQRFSIPQGRALVVQVSWLIPEKGIPDLLAAARRVIASNSAVHFALVGEGQYRDQFAEMAGDLGITGHVTWTGTVLNPVAEGVYAAADVVCQPSRWQEIFGWTITEAMSCSKPVVATRVGGIPELIQDGLNGFLVPPGDPAAIAEKLLILLSDAELRNRMGDEGRKAAESKFDLKKSVKEVIELYDLN